VSPRPQLDHVRKPQILAAAAEVIAERGLASTRIADVAERVGTSPPAVLYWFGSKDDLLAEALTVEEDVFYEQTVARLEALEHPRERLRALIDACAAEYDWTLWIELWSRALRDRGVLRARQQLDERWRRQIAEVVRAGQATGEFGEIDADQAALILTTLIDGLAVQVTLRDPSVPPERMSDAAVSAAETLLECKLPPLGDERPPAAVDGAGPG
jgi:AcrR family transcriptional regulator